MDPGGAGVMPPHVYVASLARKRMAAGSLCRDRAGRVLLVDPVYRDTWDLPGGAVEAEESPQAACRREVAEELGLDRPVGRVLALDWVPSRPERSAPSVPASGLTANSPSGLPFHVLADDFLRRPVRNAV